MPTDPHALSSLLSHAVQFGQEMVRNHGAFYPYGFALGPDGQIAMTGGWDGQEHPNPREIYQLLEQGFCKDIEARKAQAVALAADVTIPKEYRPVYPDGIRVLVEAVDFSRFIYVPYSRSPTGETRFAEMFAVEVPHAFFRRR